MPYGLVRRWALRPESRLDVPAVVTQSPSGESGLRENDPSLGFPQLTIQNTTSELRVVTEASCQGLLFSLGVSLDARGAEGTFLNFSHFHSINKLQLCLGQGPSHCSKGGCFLCLLVPPVVAHQVCEKEEVASFYCGTQTLSSIWGSKSES